MEAEFRFRRTANDSALWPTARGYGDIDKLLRNVLDALKDSGVYADDSLVVGTVGRKVFTETDGREGAWITVVEIP